VRLADVACVGLGAGATAVSHSNDNDEPAMQVFMCPPRCDAGGTPENEGHVFDIPFEEGCFSGYKCRCGLDNISFDMMRMP
jgi:hypothetical protein